MGNFNSQYQNYYNNLLNGNRAVTRRNTDFVEKDKPERKRFNIRKRIVQDLTGVLILIILVVFCKAVVPFNSKAFEIYKYSKVLINEDYDYVSVFSRIKKINLNNLNYSNIQSSTLNFIEGLRQQMNQIKIYTNSQMVLNVRYSYMGAADNLKNFYIKDKIN